MGSTAPPSVDEPRFILDRIVSDGAQVTRPSIDPYREPVETHLYLFAGSVRLSMPVAVGGLAELTFKEAAEVVKACYRMGVLVDLHGLREIPVEAVRRGTHVLAPHDAVNSGEFNAVQMTVRSPGALNEVAGALPFERKSVVARVPPLEDSEFYRSVCAAGFNGIIVDEEIGHRDAVELEIATSACDRALKVPGPDGLPLRNRVNLMASSERIRSSADAFKLIGLGAEVVVFTRSWKVAVDYGPGMEESLLAERLEYFLTGVQRELKLLAGAAGVSSLWSSLTGSRELFRSIELERPVRLKLGVKSAGEW